jgi:hypothetical protein
VVRVTWAKYGVEFFDQCADAGLTSDGTLTHAEAIAWLYRCDRQDVTDVSIPAKAIRKFANCEHPEPAIAELVRVGFWAVTDSGYVLVHHAEVVSQSLMSQRIKREVNRRSQAKARARQNVKPREGVSTDASTQEGIASNKQTSQTNTDVGAEVKDRVEPVEELWPPVALVGAGFEPSDRCPICEEPITPVDGRVHPTCYSSEMEAVP